MEDMNGGVHMDEPFDYSLFRERLDGLITSRGITRYRLAEDIGVAPGTITRYLVGTRSPDLDVLIKIARLFNTSLDYLVGINSDRYELLLPEHQSLFKLYSAASDDDKEVIKLILKKYDR